MHRFSNPALIGRYLPETNIAVQAMTVTPPGWLVLALDRYIRRLKHGPSVWDKTDIDYVFALHDEQAGRINLKDPANFALTATGPLVPVMVPVLPVVFGSVAVSVWLPDDVKVAVKAPTPLANSLASGTAVDGPASLLEMVTVPL